jgi:heme exporter protein A
LINKFNHLEARGLTCVRGEATLFSDLEISLKAAEVLQLCGPNGSGKTSLIRILCGIGHAAAGSVHWNGKDIDVSAEAFRAATCYLGHHRGVCEDLTPTENLRFFCALRTAKPVAACRAALERFGLAAHADTPARLLSAGQNQRIALARLLLCDADVWFLDEPFTAMDAEGRQLVEDIIREHAAHGMLGVIATHQAMELGVTRVTTLDLGAL